MCLQYLCRWCSAFIFFAGFDDEFVSWHVMVQGIFYNSNLTGVKKAPEGAS